MHRANPNSVLFLTVCSLTKASGGAPAYDEGLAITSLLPSKLKARLLERREEARCLVRGERELDWQGISLSDLEFNRDLRGGADFGGRHNAAYLPAVYRYDGRFFQALGSEGRRKIAEGEYPTLFLSGLYGLLLPTDPVQLYSCPLSDQISKLWRSDSLLTDILCEYIKRRDILRIFDLTAIGDYSQLIDWARIADTQTEVLHCADSMAPGDYALTSFGRLLGTTMLDMSEGELIDIQPETRIGTVKFAPFKYSASHGIGQESVSPSVSAAAESARKHDWCVRGMPPFWEYLKRYSDLFNRTSKAIEEIRQDPLSPRGDTIKFLSHNLKGKSWYRMRYRIGGFRIVYEADPKQRIVRLLDGGLRNDVYRRLKKIK